MLQLKTVCVCVFLFRPFYKLIFIKQEKKKFEPKLIKKKMTKYDIKNRLVDFASIFHTFH